MNESGSACCGLNSSAVRRGMLLLVALAMFALAAVPSIGLTTAADLRLQSEPSGASVFVNGRLAGATPLHLQALRLGTYGIRVEKEGYSSILRTVQLEKGGLDLRETLPQLGTTRVAIDIKPEGAEVFLDGELQGHTPLDLEGVRVGQHQLLIRKTNYNPYSKQIEVIADEPLVFKGFELDDKVLQMLNGNIAKEGTRVAHYMDLGHYLFVNDHLDTAAVAYSKALEVSATRLTFTKETAPEEQQLLERLRNEDRSRLGAQISLKENWPGKDVVPFTKQLEERRHELNEQHIKEWWWVSEQANWYSSVNKLAEAEQLLLHFADVNKAEKDIHLEGAHLTLLGVRLKSHKLHPVQEAAEIISTAYKAQPDVLRQAGDGLFQEHAKFGPQDKAAAAALAEKLFREGAEQSKTLKNVDLQALCEFQLAIVLAEEARLDDAIKSFRDSIGNTHDEGAKEQRTQKLIECYRTKHSYAEARTLLAELAASKHEAVASKAKQDLKELASIEAAGK
jgi:tetratricopeptide (TPR) repeat protein